eukprot:NODE_12794_length_1203_cov_7.673792.p1 GENE.NODE_12794_length_1203_cov_7.673792~~NODE_12794_length_1203_cov_7.673792.p1  ORF type:complete len:291 (-),score=51.85 NODE_12794_length_1203_cov_7.673792:193-1065(-)
MAACLRIARHTNFSRAHPRRCASALSASGLAEYKRKGWIVPPFRLDGTEVAKLRAAFTVLLERNPTTAPERLVNAHLVDGEGQAAKVHGHHAFLELGAHPRIVDLVSAALGTENVILWACHVFSKPPSKGKLVGWHQDGVYWPIEPLRACTAWVALDAADESNGAMRMIPGSHQEGELTHQRIDDCALGVGITDAALGPARLASAETVALEPGELSIHDVMVIHGSLPNSSARRRTGVALHYMAGECLFQRDLQKFADKGAEVELDYSKRPLFVVKGKNQHPSNTLVNVL